MTFLMSIEQTNMQYIVTMDVRKLDDHIFPMNFVRVIRSHGYYCRDESLFS